MRSRYAPTMLLEELVVGRVRKAWRRKALVSPTGPSGSASISEREDFIISRQPSQSTGRPWRAARKAPRLLLKFQSGHAAGSAGSRGARLVPGTVALPLLSRANASPSWIMLLLVSGTPEHGMIPAVAGFEGAPRLTIPPAIPKQFTIGSQISVCSRQGPKRSAPENREHFLGGPFSTANTNNSFVGRLARKPWRTCTSTGAPCFVCGVEHFTCHYEGVSHADWPKNEHE
jgi:hypothetical protein